MDFERYRVPKSATEGVVITLAGTKDAAFLVALPSEHNRAFTAAAEMALTAGNVTFDDNQKPVMKLQDVRRYTEARIEAFLDHCILKMPEGMTRELLQTSYYPGLKALLKTAEDMAEDESRAGEVATKKSRA